LLTVAAEWQFGLQVPREEKIKSSTKNKKQEYPPLLPICPEAARLCAASGWFGWTSRASGGKLPDLRQEEGERQKERERERPL